jgi:hypothetical protein
VFERAPRTNQRDPATGAPNGCVLVEPVGSHLHPRSQLKMPHTLAIIPGTQIFRWDNMTARGPVAAQANLLQVKPRPPRRPKSMCPSRLKAIRPPLAQRGTALRASHNAVRFGRTSGFVHPQPSPQTNEPHRWGPFFCGGEGGIRTHVTDFVRPSDFESAPLWPLRYLSELEPCRRMIF